MDAIVTYKGKDVHFLNVDPEDHIEGYLARGSFYEESVLTFIEGLQVKGNYLDAGAYVGNHSIFFRLFCPSEDVYSFEPQRSIYEKMVKNFVQNKIAYDAWNVALSDQVDIGKFSSAEPFNRGMATRVNDFAELGEDFVNIVTLDSFKLQVKLMKVDVEGMEMNLLRGAQKTLENVDYLFVEIPPDQERVDEITEFLSKKKLYFTMRFPDEQIYYFKRFK